MARVKFSSPLGDIYFSIKVKDSMFTLSSSSRPLSGISISQSYLPQPPLILVPMLILRRKRKLSDKFLGFPLLTAIFPSI